MSEEVIRHPFSAWAEDSLGESTAKTFGDDQPLEVQAFDPGGSTQLSSELDAVVVTTPALYAVEHIDCTAHDEWTVRGLRYEQEGEAAYWQNPRTGAVKTVIRLGRRTG